VEDLVKESWREAMARLCAIYASDRAIDGVGTCPLPKPGTPECDEIFLAAWAAFRYITTQIGHQLMMTDASAVRRLDPMDAFVRGRDAVPAYIRWAETASLIEAGEWPVEISPTESRGKHWSKRSSLCRL
jgi:hypothetical protein